MKIRQNTSDIKSIKCSVENETTKEDEKTYNVSVKNIPNADALFIDIELIECRKSLAISSDGCIVISTYPSFETKVLTNSEYVFLVDCSGSMRGERIKKAAKCMKIFLHSLPENCLFSIWAFGSMSECLIESSSYTKENIREASICIDNISANLGGTNLLEPLNRIMDLEIPDGFTRQIFVLTDGEIRNTKDVLASVRSKRNKNRIFSIGLGRGADAGLINGLAEIANGKSARVEDNESLAEKVIDLLEASLQPAIFDVSIVSDGMTEQWPSPAPAIYNYTQQDFIIKSPHQESILMSGILTGESVDETISVSKAPNGIGMKQLFMSKVIEDLQYELRFNPDKAKKAKVIQYSLASNILSEYTSYVGIDFERNEPAFEADMRLNILHHAKHMRNSLVDERRRSEEECLMYHDATKRRRFKGEVGYYVRKPSIRKQEEDGSISRRQQIQEEREQSIMAIEKIIDLQNPDGSWESSINVNEELVKKYNQIIASTIAAIVFIRKNAKSMLKSLKLIIKKALNFLNNFDQNIDWEEVIHNEEERDCSQ